MTNLATALANVLEADRKLARREARALKAAKWSTRGIFSEEAERRIEDVQAAKATLEAMSEELIAAMDEHISKTIIRAVASMPGQTTTEHATT